MRSGRLGILVCDSFRHELSALARTLDAPDLEFLTFPARCGRPPICWDELVPLLQDPGRFDKVVLLGNCCLDSLHSPPEALAQVYPSRLKHCFSLLCGDYCVEQYQGQGGYLVSSGWLGAWEQSIASLGFDARTSREFFGESASGIVHLDTGVLQGAPARLQAFAAQVGLPQQSVPVGLDFLKLRVERLIEAWRDERRRLDESRVVKESRKKSADYAMAFDFLKMIAQTTGKEEVVREILSLYFMMFAASDLAYVPVVDGRPGAVIRIGADASCDDVALQREAMLLDADYRLLRSGAGFLLRVVHEGTLLGVISIDGIALRQNLEQYLHLALDTVIVCAVVLNNSLNIEQVKGMSCRLRQSEQALELSNLGLEERVKARTAELESALREQATFSYSVSHDLRAPLRHINSYSTIVMEEAGETLDAPIRGYLQKICSLTNRMGGMIDSLLELSRVSRTALSSGTVDMSALANGIGTLLRRDGSGAAVEFRVEDGLFAVGDIGLLRQVLENLLGNAWKFTSKKGAPLIEFGMTCAAGKQAFFVKDNGAGFDMAYSAKLFEVFERLHGGEFEGTGIGLATVLRIIQRHNGTIWAEGSVDHGATFYFTLPGSSRLS